jgi:ribosome-binding protein aMBF1 (putative translation factor)
MDVEALAPKVQQARLARGWSKERAAREAQVSSITYKRVEDGLRVQDANLAKVLHALDLTATGEVIDNPQDDPSLNKATPVGSGVDAGELADLHDDEVQKVRDYIALIKAARKE